jgi:hypothetical protein
MTPLEQLAARTLAQPVLPAVAAMADHLRSRHDGVAAVLAYGSCLRGAAPSETLIDLYVLVDRDEDVSRSWIARAACRLVPPNVYYAQHAWDGEVLRCKYAVMTLAAFARRMERDVANPYFWARFSQPAALVHAASDVARQAATASIATAIETMYVAALSSVPKLADPLGIWQRGYAETYRTELRPESADRASEIVVANAGFYLEATSLLAHAAPLDIDWRNTRRMGKLLSLLRLAKAALTFEGGADYAAWKIERHTGQKIAVTAWQRRHPLLAGLAMLPSLWRSRALR